MQKTKLHLIPIAVLLYLCAHLEARAALSEDQLVDNAKKYIAAQEAAMAENATNETIENKLKLCADNVVYEHVEFQAKVEGKENMRRGMLSHLGETRNPKFQILKVISGYNMVMVELTQSFEVRKDDQWEQITRRRVTFFEFQEDKIRRIVDYK